MDSKLNDEDKLNNEHFRLLCKKHEVRLAILFGSRAKGEAGSESDWDLAFLINEAKQKMDRPWLTALKKSLIKDLCNHLKTSQIDLVILNRASPFLKYQIAQNGRPLYQAKEGEFASFVSLAIRSYSDSYIFRNAGKKYLEMRPFNG